MDELGIPVFAQVRWVLVTFLLLLAILHIWLVWLTPLTKIAWKRVDYVWLGSAFLGVILGVGTIRQEIASGQLVLGVGRLETAAQIVELGLQGGTGPGLCRTFVGTDNSPPPDESEQSQRQLDEWCEWFRSAVGRLGETSLDRREPLDLVAEFGNPPAEGPRWPLEGLENAVNRYNSVVEEVQQLVDSAARNRLEQVLAFLGPYLLALAIALRITKVSAEIRLGAA